MLIVDCPWCEDRMVLDDAPTAVGTCETCGISADVSFEAAADAMPLAA